MCARVCACVRAFMCVCVCVFVCVCMSFTCVRNIVFVLSMEVEELVMVVMMVVLVLVVVVVFFYRVSLARLRVEER